MVEKKRGIKDNISQFRHRLVNSLLTFSIPDQLHALAEKIDIPKVGYEDFKEIYKDRIKPSVVSFCDSGYKKMRDESKEKSHTNNHLDRLLSYLHQVLKKFPDRYEKLDLNVLLTSIVFHDLWKSQQEGYDEKGVLDLIYVNIIEGDRASKLTRSLMTEKNTLDELKKDFDDTDKLINDVCYCIYKHSDFQFLSRKTLESQMLADLDYADLWSLERINEYLSTFVKSKKIKNDSILARVALNFIIAKYRMYKFGDEFIREHIAKLLPIFLGFIQMEIDNYEGKDEEALKTET